MLLNEGGKRHMAAKQRVGEIHGSLGHIVQYEIVIPTPELEKEFGHSFIQVDILVTFTDGSNCLIIQIDGDEHQGKGTRSKDERKDEYLITKGFMVARISTDDALKQPKELILEDITYQALMGPIYT